MKRKNKTSRLEFRRPTGKTGNKVGRWVQRVPVRRLFAWGVLFVLSAMVLVAAGFAALCYHYISDPHLPKIDKAGDYHPKVTTFVLDRNGDFIGEIYEERRTLVSYAQISPHIIHAIVDAEDAQFFTHSGINQRGILRAFLHNIRPGSHKQGASTITQQLVKNYVLQSNERSLRRKVQEAYLAIHIEQSLSKEEILWIYLNHIYFGQRRYGIEEAARYYFGKSAKDVDIGEAAILASLPKAPEEYAARVDPRTGVRDWPERVKERQRYVLARMLEHGHISEQEAKRYLDAPLSLAPEVDLGRLAPEFVDEVETQLRQRYTESQIPYLGMRVRTTCDARIQRLAREALERGLQRMDERNGYRKAVRHLNEKQKAKHMKDLTKNFPKIPELSNRIIEGVARQPLDGDGISGAGVIMDLGNGVTGWLPLPKKKDRYNQKEELPSQRFRADDVLRVRVSGQRKEGWILGLENGPQGAVVVMDPQTRHVLAMVGGYGYGRKQYNRALRAKRQPGSAFKPFVYAAALETGKFTLASLMTDAPQVFDTPEMRAWKPMDHGGYLGLIRLRTALALSRNSIAAQLIYEIKPKAVIDMAHRAGIRSDLDEVYALALGSTSVGIMEMANAYATFAAAGQYADAQMIVQVGNEPPIFYQTQATISPEVAFLATSAMQSVVEEGTARAIKGKLHRQVAGKTGTTNRNNDAWFVGYTPDMLAAVWVGFDDNQPLRSTDEGARAALPIWYEVIEAAEQKRPIRSFSQPAGIYVVQIDPKSGKKPAPGTPGIDEFFLEKTVPTQEALPPGAHDPNTFNME